MKSYLMAASLTLLALASGCRTPPLDPIAQARKDVSALGLLTHPPAVHPAEGFSSEGDLRPLFF
jgi:hypothetical protein